MYRGRLEQLADVLEREVQPSGVRFNMGVWFHTPNELHRAITGIIKKYKDEHERWIQARALPTCGTAACLAGHTVMHFDGLLGIYATLYEDCPGCKSIKARAMELLDLTQDQADALFLPRIVESPTRDEAVQMLRWLSKQEDDIHLCSWRITEKWAELVAGRLAPKKVSASVKELVDA